MKERQRLCFVLSAGIAMVVVSGVVLAQLPLDAVCVEAEDGMIQNPALVAMESLFSSAGRYVSIEPASIGDVRRLDVTQVQIPSAHAIYYAWCRCVGVNVGIAKSGGDFAWYDTQAAHWTWHPLGPISPKDGPLILAVACPLTPNLGEYAVDCVLLTPDESFKPTGVYRGAVGPGDDSAQNMAPEPPLDAPTVPSVYVTVTADAEGPRVSRYLASANCHGTARHCVNSPAWDDTMRRFFSGNLLLVLESARREPNANGEWWNFAPIDEFIRKAKDVWQVQELAFLPQWWIEGWDGKSEPSEEQFSRSSEALKQVAERYGKPGPLFVKYWMCCDEWPGLTYWQNNPATFARYYARLVAEVKAVNPDLLVGGPVDCWPNGAIIEALLRECPELDFIAWNLFVSGRADYPLPQLFERTKELRKQVEASRALSQQILGRELPVMVSSYHANYHAWDPPDYGMAAPGMGVWNALALVYLGQGGAFSGVIYNVLATDCGLFGPNDAFAVKAGFQSDALPKDALNVRPLAYVHDFVNRHIAGNPMSTIVMEEKDAGIEALATCTDGDGHAAVLVNTSGVAHQLRLTLKPFTLAPYSGFELPTEYVYCDGKTLTAGQGLFFSSEGQAELFMPPYSAWCLKTGGSLGKRVGDESTRP